LPFFAKKHRFLCFYWHFTGTGFDPFRRGFVPVTEGKVSEFSSLQPPRRRRDLLSACFWHILRMS
jgi:hypothetical protein